jgi:hypothetical protein
MGKVILATPLMDVDPGCVSRATAVGDAILGH